MTSYTETSERQQLREQVFKLGSTFGGEYMRACTAEGRKTTELWDAVAQAGYLGVAVDEQWGGGGGDIGDLAAVMEELSAAGCPLLLMVVSPAICGTVIQQFGTAEQKDRWMPGFADGSLTMVFAITEPDAGSNSHNLATNVRHDEETGEWVLNGGKYYISGVDEASHVLVVARHRQPDGTLGLPSAFIVPTDAPGFTKQVIPMDIAMPEKQFTLFLDDVRVPADALVGDATAGLAQLFAGLNPERIMGAASALGMARYALDKARPVDDAEGRRALRRGGEGGRRGREHGQVRRRRGLHRRGGPGRADPRRQRAGLGVRPGFPRRRVAAGPDRPGEPRDDPELRGPAHPEAAPLVLTAPQTQSARWCSVEALAAGTSRGCARATCWPCTARARSPSPWCCSPPPASASPSPR
jgi:alkylation response protein AidB-like acyl-CoA dehydrogenase